MLYAHCVMPEPTRRLWSAVLLQAYSDLEEEAFGSYWWNQASAFFFGSGDWTESRRNVCDCLGIDPSEIRRPALRILNARRLEHGLPPVSPRPTTPRMPAPAARRAAAPTPMPLPLLVASFPPPALRPAPTPKDNGWRARYGRNPFDPFQALPSEQRAAAGS